MDEEKNYYNMSFRAREVERRVVEKLSEMNCRSFSETMRYLLLSEGERRGWVDRSVFPPRVVENAREG